MECMSKRVGRAFCEQSKDRQLSDANLCSGILHFDIQQEAYSASEATPKVVVLSR